MSEGRNFLLAAFLSFIVLSGYNMWRGQEQILADPTAMTPNISQPIAPDATQPPVVEIIERQKALASSQRIMFENNDIMGSINLETGDIDDLTLKNYNETTQSNSAHVVLLAPKNCAEGYWVSSTVTKTQTNQNWRVVSQSPKHIVIATENTQCRIERTFKIDEHFMIHLSDKITAKEATTITPSWAIYRRTLSTDNNTNVHEGGIGIINGKLQELAYKDLNHSFDHKGGWLGFTDKYWLVSIIPSADGFYRSKLNALNNIYSCTLTSAEQTLQPGVEYTHSINLFAGAKELQRLDHYETSIPADRFDRAVDFGWFYFVTKPLFYVLQYLNQLCGNLGIAILLMTIISKALTYPLTRKSYRAMERMKTVAPKVEMIKIRYKDDPTRMQQEIWALYKKEKANPIAGCLPTLMQMPLLICLYKVFSVSLEMRHAPLMGWIYDLSAPDPTNIFNLFGLLPFTPPSFLHVGLWPLLMGATMAWQQSLAPKPADPAQAKMMWIMPAMLIFLFSGFPSGVVFFWTLGNILGIAQQLWEKNIVNAKR